jgi:hypothetical protein
MKLSFRNVKLEVEVVTKPELNAAVADFKTIGEVVSFTPLEFAADHDVLDGIAQQIDQGILAFVKI